MYKKVQECGGWRTPKNTEDNNSTNNDYSKICTNSMTGQRVYCTATFSHVMLRAATDLEGPTDVSQVLSSFLSRRQRRAA